MSNLSGRKRLLSIAGAHGLRIVSTEGDRLPAESMTELLHGYPGAHVPRKGGVPGLRPARGGTLHDGEKI